MKSRNVYFNLLLLLLAFAIKSSYSSLVTKNETSSRRQQQIKELVACVQPRIYPNGSQVHNFISDDVYVQRWLRANDFDVQLTCQKLLEHLAWRRAEQIDTIDLEDWTYFRREYPQFINSDINNDSKIIVTEKWLADWDVRRATVSGQMRKLSRWLIHLLEMTERKVAELRKKGNTNLIGAVEIVDVEGFNGWQHGCSSCMSIYTSFNEKWAQQYPGLWKAVYMLNVGQVFRSLLEMGQQSRYDRDYIIKWLTHRKEWLPILDREIGRNQRSVRFGGNVEIGVNE